MKKIFIITITLCMVFVLTACSTKKEGTNTQTNNTEKKEDIKSNTQYLSCNKDYSSQMSNGITMDQDVDIKFVDNKIETFVMSMNFEIPSNLANNADTLVNSMKSTYDSSYGKYNGVTIKLERTSKTEFSIVITMDFKNMSATDKQAVGLSGSEDYTINRTSFIREGYTCE